MEFVSTSEFMANDFKYLESEDFCDSEWRDFHSPADPVVDDWDIGELYSLEGLESWYGKIALKVVLEPEEVTASQLRFIRLRKEWIRGTEKLSILSQIVLHPAYQQIIAMGPAVIPLILQSLEAEPDHWFWALKMLNDGIDVADGEDTISGAAAAWLKWGRENGYLDSRIKRD